MRELPIPYTEVMVVSLLQNLKTMTRRTKGLERVNENPEDWKIVIGDWSDKGVLFFNKHGHSDRMKPKYQIGELLWVKETFSHAPLTKETKPFYPELSDYIYKAGSNYSHIKWTTSRFMPKAAARTWLEVTDIKCERLQDISPEDCIAEGILPLNMSAAQLAEQGQKYFDYSKPKQHFVEGLDPFWSFNSLWCSINGGDSWDANPWVFAYTFKRVNRDDG